MMWVWPTGRASPGTRDHSLPLIPFEKRQDKDKIAAQYRSRFTASEGVVLVGKAQEKASVFRTEKRRNPDTGRSYPWLVRSTDPRVLVLWSALVMFRLLPSGFAQSRLPSTTGLAEWTPTATSDAPAESATI
jgi:hypothetical protein